MNVTSKAYTTNDLAAAVRDLPSSVGILTNKRKVISYTVRETMVVRVCVCCTSSFSRGDMACEVVDTSPTHRQLSIHMCADRLISSVG